MKLVELAHRCCDVSGDSELVISAHHDARLMQVLVQRDLLWHEDMHLVGLLTEAHAFDWKQILAAEILQICSLFKDIIDYLLLNHLEINDSGQQWESRLFLLIKCLDLVERTEWVLLLTFVELLVETKLFRLRKDRSREVERLGAVGCLSE